ncbi:Cmk2 [Desulfamplus magnetovallimortis]|uniref:Cmk2 n=1 Tax=Desulfamplus magnetovallimortis TaxID=1246637 RepID=A0A1W1HAI6_9BACT|nr:cytidylate kinase-like family protein [Desulfamplus magnetovallimortis]SLM29514.1 Cmk2 [Desulfamplus magnetovallimortis]
MPIVTISRGSYNRGRAVAEKLAQKIGYTCISRDEVIENLDEFHLQEIKLVRGLNDAFSVLDRFPNGKKRFVSAIRAALLQRFMAGNVVYHGLVGHHFVKTISHVLKVRIIADTESRVADEMNREDISAEKARFILKSDDEERRKWCMFLYGIDLFDAEIYNLVIRVGHLSEDDAVDIITNAVKLPSFQETAQSRAELADSALSSIVTYALFDFPSASVSARDGHVKVVLKVPEDQCSVIKERIEAKLSAIDAVKEQSIIIDPYY